MLGIAGDVQLDESVSRSFQISDAVALGHLLNREGLAFAWSMFVQESPQS